MCRLPEALETASRTLRHSDSTSQLTCSSLTRLRYFEECLYKWQVKYYTVWAGSEPCHCSDLQAYPEFCALVDGPHPAQSATHFRNTKDLLLHQLYWVALLLLRQAIRDIAPLAPFQHSAHSPRSQTSVPGFPEPVYQH